MENNDFASELLAGSSLSTAAAEGKTNLIDKLYNLFSGDDMVKIINFTDKPTGWVYSDRKTTIIEHPDQYTRRVIPGEQKVRVVNPKKSIVVPGYEAYVGMVRFFKQWVQDGEESVAVTMNSPIKMEEFIKKAYGGIYDPNEAVEEPVDVKTAVEEDLGLVKDEKKAGKQAK